MAIRFFSPLLIGFSIFSPFVPLGFSNDICDVELLSSSRISKGEWTVSVLSSLLENEVLSLEYLEQWIENFSLKELISLLEIRNKGVAYVRLVSEFDIDDSTKDEVRRWVIARNEEQRRRNVLSEDDQAQTKDVLVLERLDGVEAYGPGNKIVGRFSESVTTDIYDGRKNYYKRSDWIRPGRSAERVLVTSREVVFGRSSQRRVHALPRTAIGMSHIYGVGDEATLWVPVLGGSVLVYRLLDFTLLGEVSFKGEIISPIWSDMEMVGGDTSKREDLNSNERVVFMTSDRVIYYVNSSTLEIEYEVALDGNPVEFCHSKFHNKTLYLLEGESSFRSIQVNDGILNHERTSSWCKSENSLNGFRWQGEWYVFSLERVSKQKAGIVRLIRTSSGESIGLMPIYLMHSYIRQSSELDKVYFTNIEYSVGDAVFKDHPMSKLPSSILRWKSD